MNMWYGVVGLASLIVWGGGCVQHDRKDLMRSTNISLSEAVRSAEAVVPDGRAVEAELEQKEGRTVYEVELIDSKQDLRKVYVDASTGKVVRIH